MAIIMTLSFRVLFPIGQCDHDITPDDNDDDDDDDDSVGS